MIFNEVKWRVSDKTEKRKNHVYRYCQCVCGVESWVRTTSLMRDSLSCKRCSNMKRTHGMVGTQIYNSWSGMKMRCDQKGSIGYKIYGGRGIKYCEQWKSFEAFRIWAIKNGYKPGLSLERKDVNGNYEPENCSWVTRSQQSRNTRRNVFFEKDGKKLCLKDWCTLLGKSYASTMYRVNKKGWSIEQALSHEPLRRKKGC